MNARLIKETKDLLPAFAVTLLLIVAPHLLMRDLGTDARQVLQGFGLLALGLACVIMGGSSFGNEFQHRTLPLLLSQPIARSVLWRDKMLVLGAGMVTSLVVLAACQAVCCPVHDSEGWVMLVLIPLAAFCGAPYWTLLLRHGIGGMVFSVAIPVWIIAMAALVAEHLRVGERVGQDVINLLLLLFVSYCALVYWLGYAKFARLEALDGPSRELSLPTGLEAVFVRPLSKLAARFRSPFATLLKKEFRLQQISFLLAGLFVLIAVVGFSLIKHRPLDVATAIVGGDYMIYMVILPLIAGAISLGEEKGWGIAEWHLILPPSALKQWSAKMLATLSTSLALGLFLPAVLLLVGQRLLGRHDNFLPPVPVFFGWVLAQMIVTSVAVYAATLSRSTLRAILGAMALIAVGGGVFAAVSSQGGYIFPLVQQLIGGPIQVPEAMYWRLFVGLVICLPCFLLCLMQGLAFFNFRRHGSPVLRGLTQFIVLLLVCWMLSVVYLLSGGMLLEISQGLD